MRTPTCVDVIAQVQRCTGAGGPRLGFAQVVDAQPLALDEAEQVLPLALLDSPEQVFLSNMS